MRDADSDKLEKKENALQKLTQCVSCPCMYVLLKNHAVVLSCFFLMFFLS